MNADEAYAWSKADCKTRSDPYCTLTWDESWCGESDVNCGYCSYSCDYNWMLKK